MDRILCFARSRCVVSHDDKIAKQAANLIDSNQRATLRSILSAIPRPLVSGWKTRRGADEVAASLAMC